MHFTLWPSLTQSEGGHGEIDWPSFVEFVRNPVIAPDKSALEGWSPAKFKGNRRKASACELVSAIVLDDDSSGLPFERILEMWGDVAGVFHSSHSATLDFPKWRIVLRCSRDMTADEHARVWAAVRDVAASRGQSIDAATKDPSRLWFVPAHREGAPYACASLVGEPLDVDAILAVRDPDTTIAPAIPPRASASAPADRRHAMAVALGSAWPAKGRHEAQLALAGALRAEGFSEADALEFLCTVTRVAGDENRSKREATIRDTYGKPQGSALTGWTRLKAFVDPVVVDAARGAIGHGADLDGEGQRPARGARVDGR